MAIEREDVEVEISHGLCGRRLAGRSQCLDATAVEADSQSSAGLLEVRILHSPLDRPREPFIRPLEPAHVKTLLDAWGQLIFASSDDGRPCREVFEQYVPAELSERLFETEELDAFFERCELRPSGSPESQCRKLLAQRVGERLCAALLPGRVGETFGHCLEHRDRHTGLRLRISFGDRERYLPEVIGLPWELLYHPGTGAFLGAGTDTQIVRYLDTPRRVAPLATAPPLKVLAVLSSPDDQPHIELTEQKQRLQEATIRHPWIELRFLEKATLARLRERLLKDRFHVVHFLGHGSFREHSGEGVLFFEWRDGSSHKVTATDLAEQLEGIESLRLVVLNACVGARMLRQRDQHLFTGTAPALLARGIPAVVAMQFSISKRAAFSFSNTFYAQLGEGRPIDEAVAEARLRMKAEDPEPYSFQWATPVLFLQSPDGRILSFEKATDRPPPKRIAIFNWLDIGQEMMESADYQIDLTAYFEEGRFIARPELWNQNVIDVLRYQLARALAETNTYHFDFAAASSLAFAAGYLAHAKRGIAMLFTQRGARGASTWRFDEPTPPRAPGWKREWRKPSGFPLRRGAEDVAVTVSVTNDVLPGVRKYLESEALEPPRIGHVIHAGIRGGPSQRAVKNGGHAFQLAERLANRIHVYTSRHRAGTLHVFASAPNVLLFYLGQLSEKFARIQLYEYDFKGERSGTYSPSITLHAGIRLKRSDSASRKLSE